MATVTARVAAAVGALALLASSCAGGATVEPAAEPADASSAQGSPPPWPWELASAGVDVPAAVPLEEIRPGGPPPDGIPAIDEPVLEDVDAAAGWLEPRDPVLVVEVAGDARAYPLAILTFHEIVNDVVGGEPLAVTYCPLCNSGLVFARTVDGEALDFGTSGRLWNSNLVMYDRASRSLWSQFTGEAIVGDRLGARLERVPAQIVAFATFAEHRPGGRVLSRDTGHDRPYGTNPYIGYDSSSAPFLYDGETSDVLPQMARVVTTGGAADPVAYPLELLRRERVVHDEVGGEPVVVLWAPGTASALDRASVAAGADVGATGVFRATLDGQPVELLPEGEAVFHDRRTGSTWDVLGEAVDGPLEGARLTRVPHDDTFWFVQYAFRPGTRVAGVSGG